MKENKTRRHEAEQLILCKSLAGLQATVFLNFTNLSFSLCLFFNFGDPDPYVFAGFDLLFGKFK